VIEPLHLEVELACPADHAFRVWTERFAQWWPRGHTMSGDPDAIVFEPWLGGRIYERAAGREIDWGEVTAWAPPRSFSYLWRLRRDRRDATEVTVTIVALDEGSSRLEIVHRGWERLGAGGPGWRDANANGWAGLLPHYIGALNQRERQP